jgi:RNA methyltransferase, TrmH family
LRASLSGEARRPGDLLGLEGPNLIREAHLAGYAFETLFLRDGNTDVLNREAWLNELRVQHWVVLSEAVFDATVTTRSPQGVAATCVLRKLDPPLKAPVNTLILEQIQDPGNLGTLLRSAEGFGVRRVMVTSGTANEWSPKVMRSAAGAVLRNPVQRGSIEDLVRQLRAEGVRIFAAVAHFEAPFQILAPHGVLTGRALRAEKTGETRIKLAGMEGGPASSLSYDTDFQEPFAIMVGNEGAGLSKAALALADEQVMIPGSSESLNAAVAGSILMYEAMRQGPLRLWAREQGLRQ